MTYNFSCSISLSHPFLVFHLAGFGGEQFIEFGVFREVIRKGQNDIVEEQQPVARLGIGHIGKLFRRNIQPLRQYLPVAAALVESYR